MTTLQAKTFDGSGRQHRIAYFGANALTNDPIRQVSLLAKHKDEMNAHNACIAGDPMVPC
jgi:hypothetical protein